MSQGQIAPYLKNIMLHSIEEIRAAKLVIEVLGVEPVGGTSGNARAILTVALTDKDGNRLVDIRSQAIWVGSTLTVCELDQLLNVSLT